MKVANREEADAALIKMQKDMPAVASAYTPSGRLPVSALLGLLLGSLLSVPIAVIFGIVLLLLAPYLFFAAFGVLRDIMQWVLPLRVLGLTLATPVCLAVAAGCIIGPWLGVALATTLTTNTFGKRGKNRNVRAAAIFSCAAAGTAIFLMKVAPEWRLAATLLPSDYTRATQNTPYWLAIMIALFTVGVAAFMAAASVRTSKFCERCNRYMVELQPKPANATSLKDLVTAISGANWHECATLLQVTTAETGGEVTFARCPQCNDTYCELTVKIKAA